MRLGGLLSRQGRRHPQRDLAVFDLLAELVELGLLAGVAADQYGMAVVSPSPGPW